MQRVSPLVFFLLIIPQLTSAGNSPGNNLADARQAFEEATVLYQNKQYSAAAAKFRAAYALKPVWRLMFNIGQSEAAARRYGLALEAFENYLVEGGDDIEVARQDDVYAEMTRLRKIVGILKVITRKNSTIWIDGMNRGTPPMPGGVAVAAGKPHTVKAVFDGQTRREATFSTWNCLCSQGNNLAGKAG